MFDSIYNDCDSSPKDISCFCGKVNFVMSNGKPRRVLECCCEDCFQHLEWAASKGGPKAPTVPTLSYWDNDLKIVKGEHLLQVVILRTKGRSHRLISECCYSTLMVDHPFYNGVMFMLFEDACKVQWDDLDKPPNITRPAESRVFVNDFENYRGKMPEFKGNQERIHNNCCPPYIHNWNIKSSQYLDDPKGEKCQSIFERVPRKILGLEVGTRIIK